MYNTGRVWIFLGPSRDVIDLPRAAIDNQVGFFLIVGVSRLSKEGKGRGGGRGVDELLATRIVRFSGDKRGTRRPGLLARGWRRSER